MDWNLILRRIQDVSNYDAFVELELELSRGQETHLFDFLFTHSISGGRGGGVAACLLIEIDPAPTRSCKELLAEIAKSKWNVSTKEVPFFMISWFGKRTVRNTCQGLIGEANLTPEQTQRVSTIIYWTNSPAANLIRSYHDWPWREADDAS
ncbi:hypothetical protein [Massilia suwonensis]|uniref:Uncharacterized protein n=1 Tax=Massilia suwonensis TaxID=648895 RepID=A0ABW0MQR0_9BURK